MAKNYHMNVDLHGVLMNWNDRDWKGCATADDGRVMSPAEVKSFFLDKIAQGDRFYPMGACDGFDPNLGCPGHEVFADDENVRAS